MSSSDAGKFVGDAEIAVAGWGTAKIDDEFLKNAPGVKLVCYSAGSIKGLVTDAMWDRGVILTSAAAAIAVGVAETSLALIILSSKNIWHAAQVTSGGGWRNDMDPEPADFVFSRIGIVAASHVGRAIIGLLSRFEVEIVLYDPYVDDAQAAELGVTKVDLDELMSTSDVVSVHLPATDETDQMLGSEQFAQMKDGATIINTSRGAVIDEDALIRELKTGRITACLDVTSPEPPTVDSPFRTLDNVILMPHMAGTVAKGRRRLGQYVAEEIRRWTAGEPQRYEVTRDMLPTMA